MEFHDFAAHRERAAAAPFAKGSLQPTVACRVMGLGEQVAMMRTTAQLSNRDVRRSVAKVQAQRLIQVNASLTGPNWS